MANRGIESARRLMQTLAGNVGREEGDLVQWSPGFFPVCADLGI